jgi:signal peptidase I
MSETQTPSSPAGWPRSLFAGALSFVIPGLGQIFAGAWQLGIRLYLIFGLGGTILIVGFTRLTAPRPAMLVVFALLTIGFGIAQLAIAADATRRVRRGYERPRRSWYQSTLLDAVTMLTINGLIVSNIGWQSFHAASGSNLPTLVVGDYMMADTRSQGTMPALGDMVVFRPTGSPEVHWVKRVVGLPGDRVQMRGGVLFLNGKEVQREAAGEYALGFRGKVRKYVETLPNGRRYSILKMTDDGPGNNTSEYLVPPGAFFVLGDHRDDSVDSRHPRSMGAALAANVTGPVRTIYWSQDRSRILTPVD